MSDLLIVVLLLGAAAYRTGRFVVLDPLIDEPRDRVFAWLAERDESLLYRKLAELIGCPYCMTIWTGGFATLFWALVLADWPGWWFLVIWMAVSTAALIIWEYVDAE